MNGSYLTDGAPAGVVLDAVQLLNQPLVDLRWEGTGRSEVSDGWVIITAEEVGFG